MYLTFLEFVFVMDMDSASLKAWKKIKINEGLAKIFRIC